MEFAQAFDIHRNAVGNNTSPTSLHPAAYPSHFLWPWSYHQSHSVGASSSDFEKVYGSFGHATTSANASGVINRPKESHVSQPHQLSHQIDKMPMSSTSVANFAGGMVYKKMNDMSLDYSMTSPKKETESATPLSFRHLTPAIASPPKKVYKCKLCHQCCISRQDLQLHNNSMHKNELRPFPCDQCGRQFATLAYLGQHQRIHAGLKPYTCRYCEKSFTQLSHVQQHERIHTGEKPYHCWICNKAFTQMSNLQSHKRQHLKDKAFRCDSCFMCYDNHADLEMHVKGQQCSGANNLPKVCGKNYNSETYLNKHLKSHKHLSMPPFGSDKYHTAIPETVICPHEKDEVYMNALVAERNFRLPTNVSGSTAPGAADVNDTTFLRNQSAARGVDYINSQVLNGLNGFGAFNGLLGAGGVVASMMSANGHNPNYVGLQQTPHTSNASQILSLSTTNPICATTSSSNMYDTTASQMVTYRDVAAVAYDMGGLFGGFPSHLSAYSRY